MFSAEIDGNGVMKLRGRLDASEAKSAEAALASCSGTLTLDMTELEYISSVGLGVIVNTHQRLSGSGGTLVIVGMPAKVRHVFAMTHLDRLLNIR